MHTGALTTLEFDRVVEVVTSFALTPLGAEKLARLHPLTDPRAVQTVLSGTSETVRFFEANNVFPLDAPIDLDTILASLAIEAQALEPGQLLGLANFLESVTQSCESITTASGGPFPALVTIIDGCARWSRECDDVRKKIDASNQIVDDASPVLKAIRSRLQKQRNRLRGNLESYLRGRETTRYLQEQVVTERNGRFVLTVRSSHRNAIPGIVHGSSGSGASLFLEPLSTVDINNELVALEEQERDEVRKVLLTLSTAFRRRANDLRRTLTVATDLDVLQARASFSVLIGGSKPRISTDQTLELREAKHPLLMTSVTSRLKSRPLEGTNIEPVPVDIIMKAATRALIITGPNTGGKTAALKTAGVLCLMTQAGLHVPVAPGSSVPVFKSIFADIGDEQSITANLSTFSGHIANIVEMDNLLALPALILLDEVGAGTDPVEGGALGRAIVDHFRERGAHVIATTHDDTLKTYGATTDGVTCAAFGFDPDTFTPNYRLVYGSSGRSLALEIASRLGIYPQIIESAKKLRSNREEQLAEHLACIDKKERQLDELSELLDQRQVEFTDRAARLTERETKIERLEQAGRKDLQQSLDTQLRTARKKIDEVIENLRERATLLEREAAERAVNKKPALSTGDGGALRAEARKAVETITNNFQTSIKPLPSSTRSDDTSINVGTIVMVSTLGVEGAVRSVHDHEAEVEVRGKRVRVPIESLTASASQQTSTEPNLHSRVSIQAEGQKVPSDELKLIGFRVDEALALADKHLDNALLGEQLTVRFVHGHGTGQLRRAIVKFLEEHPLVRRVSPATPEKGGRGVTIAELKE